MLASAPAVDAKASIFSDLADQTARYVSAGLDKRAALDELQEIAAVSGLIDSIGQDDVQVRIADAFMRVEYEPEWLREEQKEETPPPPKGNGHARQPRPAPLPPILSKAAFLARYGKPPNYLIDDFLQRGFIYALTGQTGHAKTAVALLIARLVGSTDENAMLGYNRVHGGRVIYFCGENPDDVSWRIKGSDFDRKRENPTDDPEHDCIAFIAGVFDIARMIAVLEKEKLDIALIIIDTSAAYFLGNEELSNTQMGAYARLLRKLTLLPGNPCVLVLCHPIKHVTEWHQLLPRGGGAYLAEMDGNLTLWKTSDETVELNFTKLRGPGFQPFAFSLKPINSPHLRDSRDRPVSTIHAVPITKQEEEKVTATEATDAQRVIVAMLKRPVGLAEEPGSYRAWAEDLGWKTKNGDPYHSKVRNIIGKLAEKPGKKLVQRDQWSKDRWVLTQAGEEQAQKLKTQFDRAEAAHTEQQERLNI
jgi:AAA domain-containing protein